MNLPFILGIQAEVSDAFGEIVLVKTAVTVSQSTSTNYNDILATIANFTDAQTKLQYYSIAAYQVNYDASLNKTSTSAAAQVNN